MPEPITLLKNPDFISFVLFYLVLLNKFVFHYNRYLSYWNILHFVYRYGFNLITKKFAF